MNLIELCEDIEEGYKVGKSGLDDDMLPLLIELGDQTTEIRALAQAAGGPLGTMWWVADDLVEFQEDITRLVNAGCRILKVDPTSDEPRIHYTFALLKSKAEAILGYKPDDEEWMD